MNRSTFRLHGLFAPGAIARPSLAFFLIFFAAAGQAASPQPPFLCPSGGACSSDSDAPYDLGALPFSISWPAPPNTDRDITVVAGSISSLQNAVATSGARVTVPAGRYVGALSFADDVEILMDDNATWVMTSDQNIANVDRVRWIGGVIDGSNFSHQLAWFDCDDWMFNNVRMQDMESVHPFNGDSGSRWAYVNVTIRAQKYAWFSLGAYNGTPTKYSDAIIANSDLHGGIPSGAEATVRWQRVARGVVVDSMLANDGKHDLRTHYGSREIYVRNNLLVEGTLAAMYTNGSGDSTDLVDDRLGAHWYLDNEFYLSSGNPQNIQRGPWSSSDFIGAVVVRDNRSFNINQDNPDGEEGRRFPGEVNPEDVSTNNIEFPYRSPPAFNGGADH